MADRVLVTGATGFIAQHCVLQLLEAGYLVRGTARSNGRTDRIRAVLHWSPRNLEEMTTSMADSMVRYGVVKAPTR